MMNTDTISFPSVKKKNKDTRKLIKVFGVGGAGTNIVQSVIKSRIKNQNSQHLDDIIEYYICNTDLQHLRITSEELEENYQFTQCKTIFLTLPGEEGGLGAGGEPQNGEKAALENISDFEKALDKETQIVFIIAGLGGGTGTGAAPVIAKLCKEKNILCIGFVVRPMMYQGADRTEYARAGIEKMRQFVDALMVIDNDKVNDIFGIKNDISNNEAEEKINNVLAMSIQAILQIIGSSLKKNVDIKDITSALKGKGTALIGIGRAKGEKGENRATQAIEEALNSPLLDDNDIEGATNAIWVIWYNKKSFFTRNELTVIYRLIQEAANTGLHTDIKDGEGYSDDLDEDEIMVVLIATGFPESKQHKIANTEPKKEYIPLNSHIVAEQKPISSDFQGITEEKEKNTTFENNISKEEATSEEFNSAEEFVFDLNTPSNRPEFYSFQKNQVGFSQENLVEEPKNEVETFVETTTQPINFEQNSTENEVPKIIDTISVTNTTPEKPQTISTLNILVSPQEISAKTEPSTIGIKIKERVQKEENKSSTLLQQNVEELRKGTETRTKTFGNYNSFEAVFGNLKNASTEELMKKVQKKSEKVQYEQVTSPNQTADFLHNNNVD